MADTLAYEGIHMRTSMMYRRVPGLLAIFTLFATSFLFSGCQLLCTLCLQTENRQDPAIVLITRSGDYAEKVAFHRIVKVSKGTESVELDFDWNKWTIGGQPLNLLLDKADAKEWQLNVYDYESGNRIPDGRPADAFLPISTSSTKLKNLPLDQLLRAELLFRLREGSDAPMGEPLTIVFLFKKGKEIPM